MVKAKSKKQEVKLQIKIQNFRREWRGTIRWGLGILGLFFFIRLVNLTLLPIFADEAIYIRWSQVMRAEPTLRFLPLSDGKQPLFMWLAIPFLKIFSDPLFAGRFLSILGGFGSLVGLFLLSYVLFEEKRVSLIVSLLYTLVPFFVFFDRMALVDSLLAMFGIWTAFLGILLVRRLRLDLAMISGMILGAGLITKSPAVFFAILLPSTILVADWFDLQQGKKMALKILKLAGLWGVVYLFALVIYNLLRLGPNFKMIAIRNKDYVFSVREIFSHPLDPLKSHLGDLLDWLPNLLTWPVLLLAAVGLTGMWIKGKRRREVFFLFLLAIVPLLAQSIFARVFTPRYILFTAWPLLILAAFTFTAIVGRLVSPVTIPYQRLFCWGFVLILLIISCLRYDFYLLTEPEKAPLPRKMRSGYLEEWTAGQGIRRIAEFVRQESLEKNILIGTEGAFGTLPDGLQVYLEKVPNITIIGVGYPISRIHESLVNSLIDNDVYLVVNQSRLQVPPEAYGLKLVKEFPKAVNPQDEQDRLLLFEVEKEFWLR